MAGKVPAELTLDVLESAAKRSSGEVKAKLERYEAQRAKDDGLAGYRECLVGGDAEAGKKIFLERADVSCVRCHKAQGQGGEVGPELTGIGSRVNREYVLESIVHPNTKIAPGFETVLVTMKDGTSYAGLVKKETDTTLDLNSPEDGLITLKKSEIETRARGMSGMPEELRQMLTKQDLRNLVEYLSTLK
jgi:quinoprotein glucose dehydrogenase